ncbi:Chromo domain protein LHP1 [Capsicum chinense]|nr:Chromo domain protein LHP1 [Capsicum chinense]
MANSSFASDIDNSTGDIREFDLVVEVADDHQPPEDVVAGDGEEDSMPLLAGEEMESEEENEQSEEIPIEEESFEGDGDSEEEEEEKEINEVPEEISIDEGIPDDVDDGSVDGNGDGEGDAEAVEHQERDEASEDVYITELIRPVVYAATFINDKHDDVSITFLAKRSDGKEMLVDNKFLKINNPLLLIDFYEQIV